MLIVLLAMFACTGSKKLSRQNLSYLYNAAERSFSPLYRVYHVSDTKTEVYFKLHKDEILFTRENPESDFSARVTLSYILYNSYESTDIADSASIDFFFFQSQEILSGYFTLSIPEGKNYLLEIKATDENKSKHVKAFINVFKDKNTNRQYFNLKDTTGNLIYTDYLSENKDFILQYSGMARILYVSFYGPSFPIAPPPFATINDRPIRLRADSTFVISLDKDGMAKLNFYQQGVYNIYADTVSKNGYCVCVFDKDFPKFTESEKLLEPLRYLTAKTEFDQMNLLKNKKEAVDQFWLESGGSVERARQLIRRFYNRAMHANIYFTSYFEGWKTDRGMIYIVFGPPNIIYKSAERETWIYGEANNINSVTFNFMKVGNPFTDNDYSLARSPTYKLNWYNAVEMWRR